MSVPLQPGIHPLTAEAYHADPADGPSLSAHIAHVLLTRSPKHAWCAHPKLNPNFERVTDDKFDLGTAAHAVLLQGEQIAEREETLRLNGDSVSLATVVDVDAKPFGLIVPCEDWRKRIAQDLRNEARSRGLIALLEKDWKRVKEMVEAVREQLPSLEVDPPMFTNGKAEQTVIWQEQGITCRALIDWLHDDLTAIDDLKSVPTKGGSASPFDWPRRTFWGIGADIEARFHARGVKAITGTLPRFRFLVVEAFRPYGMSVVDLSPAVEELADRKIDRAIELWRRCIESDEWPAYARQIASIELDGWQDADFLARHWEPGEEKVAA